MPTSRRRVPDVDCLIILLVTKHPVTVLLAPFSSVFGASLATSAPALSPSVAPDAPVVFELPVGL